MRSQEIADFSLPPAVLASAKHEDAQPELEQLDKRVHQFYNSDITSGYFVCAEAVNMDWDSHPYHQAIREQVRAGMKVLDLGCGCGHALRNIRSRDIWYTGIDWSARQIELNSQRFSEANAIPFIVSRRTRYSGNWSH